MQGARKAIDSVSGSLENPLLVVPVAKASSQANGDLGQPSLQKQTVGHADTESGGVHIVSIL